jgi:hypothetical protein
LGCWPLQGSRIWRQADNGFADALRHVAGRCDDRHRPREWLKFLRAIDDVTPQQEDLHPIVDNYATHKAERFFRDLTQMRLKRGVFRDVEELITAKATDILQKVTCACQTPSNGRSA